MPAGSADTLAAGALPGEELAPACCKRQLPDGSPAGGEAADSGDTNNSKRQRPDSHIIAGVGCGWPETAAVAAAAAGGAGTAAGEAAAGGGDPLASLPDAPMHLMRVRGIPSWANEGFLGVTLGDLVRGDMRWCLVCNFMLDFCWLLSACPDLHRATRLVLVHGELPGSPALAQLSKDVQDYNNLHSQRAQRDAAHTGAGPAATADAAAAAATAGGGVVPGRQACIMHAPPLPFEYGTHHSKAFIIEYKRGLRVIIFTANVIYRDCNNKTQGIFFQDFPPKDELSPQDSPFEQQLAEYLRELRLPPAIGRAALALVARHDFSAARAHIIASVPGRHTGAALHRWGHMRLRALLRSEPAWPAALSGAPLALQCSSLGGFTPHWLNQELSESLAAGRCSGGPKGDLGPPPAGPAGMPLVWTTSAEVQHSLEGWAGGRSIPGRAANVNQPFMQPYYRRWGGEVCGRQRALPHIKTYVRFKISDGNCSSSAGGSGGSDVSGQKTTEIAWAYVGSHNLSKAAWGGLEKQGSQLMLRSYELGVLLTPAREAAYRSSRWRGFSCTSGTYPATSPSCPSQRERQQQEGAAAAAAAGGGVAAAGGGVAAAAAAACRGAAADAGAGPEVCFTQWQAGMSQEAYLEDAAAAAATGGRRRRLVVPLPIPYSLPPVAYQGGEQPWASDSPWAGVDSLGHTRSQAMEEYTMYGILEPAD